MKKTIGIIIFVVALVFIIPTTIFAYPNINNNETSFYQSMPCHQRENQERGYEWYYAHLSSEDQAHVDAKFITLLNDVAFTTLEPSEQAETLQNIKEQLIDYIIEMEFSLRRRP